MQRQADEKVQCGEDKERLPPAEIETSQVLTGQKMVAESPVKIIRSAMTRLPSAPSRSTTAA